MSTDLNLRFLVDQPPEQVFAAILDVHGWWSKGIEGTSQKPGDVFRYRHGKLHDSTQKLVALTPSQEVDWLVTDANLRFPRSDEWKGTHLRFEVRRVKGKTEVLFTQPGLTAACQCFEACSAGWGFYVGESLKALIETGTGTPDEKPSGARSDQ